MRKFKQLIDIHRLITRRNCCGVGLVVFIFAVIIATAFASLVLQANNVI
jgi:hypothetical protein